MMSKKTIYLYGMLGGTCGRSWFEDNKVILKRTDYIVVKNTSGRKEIINFSNKAERDDFLLSESDYKKSHLYNLNTSLTEAEIKKLNRNMNG